MSDIRSGTKHIALSNSILIEPYLIIGFVGIAFNFAWVFLMYGTNVFAPIGPYSDFRSLNVRLVLMASVSVAYIAGWILSDFLFDKRMLLAFFTVFFGTANCWPVIFPGIFDTFAVVYLFWVLTGIGYASSFLLWSEFLSTLNVHRSKIFIAGALLFGVVFAWPISLMIKPVSLFVALILPVLSCCALLFLERSYAPLVSRVRVTKEDSDKRQTLTARPIIATWASSIAFGFVLFYSCSHAIESHYVTSVIALAFALACIAILVDSMKYRVINEDLLLKIFLPTAALGFFSLLLFGPILRLI
ncbi:MAG: hypothetical protein HGA54_03160, partial [Actinobacteria bacterium]|nr:hypothetical protein [Actinomycetota bacterium]